MAVERAPICSHMIWAGVVLLASRRGSLQDATVAAGRGLSAVACASPGALPAAGLRSGHGHDSLRLVLAPPPEVVSSGLHSARRASGGGGMVCLRCSGCPMAPGAPTTAALPAAVPRVMAAAGAGRVAAGWQVQPGHEKGAHVAAGTCWPQARKDRGCPLTARRRCQTHSPNSQVHARGAPGGLHTVPGRVQERHPGQHGGGL
jgi:hypothetical protein